MTARRKRTKQKPLAEVFAPTPEFEKRHATRSAGMARRIIPMIDILAERGDLTPREHNALAYYRDQASLAERSPVKSCCDNTPGGSGNGPGVAIMSASIETARLERKMGALWRIARAIAVNDWSLSRWCVEQYGGRERYDKNGKLVAIVPVGEQRRLKEARREIKLAASKLAG
jgi:hypothetical protein